MIDKFALILRFAGDAFPCGIRDNNSERIPWMASLKAKGDTNSYQHFCSGSLITKKHVLTAHHCIYRIDITKYDIKVVLNDFDLTKVEDGEVYRTVEELIIHPGKNFEHLSGDWNLSAVLTHRLGRLQPRGPQFSGAPKMFGIQKLSF